MRVYSGTLRAGSAILNSINDKKERVGRLLQMHANHREDLQAVFAGDIVAVVGLRHHRRHPLRPEAADRSGAEAFAQPVIHLAIEPKTKIDQDKLGSTLHR